MPKLIACASSTKLELKCCVGYVHFHVTVYKHKYPPKFKATSYVAILPKEEKSLEKDSSEKSQK